jgi:hypothetical protein
MLVQVPSLRQRNAHARALEALLIGALPEQGTAIVSTPLPGSKGFVSGENSPYKPMEKMHGL